MLIDSLLPLMAIVGTATLSGKSFRLPVLEKIPHKFEANGEVLEDIQGFQVDGGRKIGFYDWLEQLKKIGAKGIFYIDEKEYLNLPSQIQDPSTVGPLFTSYKDRLKSVHYVISDPPDYTKVLLAETTQDCGSVRLNTDWQAQLKKIELALEPFLQFASDFKVQPFRQKSSSALSLLRKGPQEVEKRINEGNSKMKLENLEPYLQEAIKQGLAMLQEADECTWNTLKLAGAPPEVISLHYLAGMALPSGIYGMNGYYDSNRPTEEIAAFEKVYPALKEAATGAWLSTLNSLAL